MRILGRLLLCVVLIGLGSLIGAAAVAWIDDLEVNRSTGDAGFLLPLILQIVLVFVFVSLSIFVIAKIFDLAFRWGRWSVRQSKASVTVSLICFAVAVYFFPAPVLFGLRQGWAFLSELLGNFPALVQQATNAENVCASARVGYCVSNLIKIFSNSWSIFVQDAISRLRIDQFPLLDAVFLTTIWLGMANIVSRPAVLQGLSDFTLSVVGGLADRAKSMSATFRVNAAFVIILIVGAYLSFSSVIAIPSLQEAVQQEATKPEELRTRLKGVALSSDDFDKRFPIIPKLSLFEASASSPTPAVSTGKSRGADVGERPPDAGLQSSGPEAGPGQGPTSLDPSYLFFGRTAARRFENLRSNYQSLRDDFRSSQFTVMDLATETFDLSNRGRKGNRETQQHFLSIDLWYRQWWEQKASVLNACRVAVERVSSELSDLADMLDAMQRSAGASSRLDLTSIARNQGDTEGYALSACSTSDTTNYNIPRREDFGGYLGVFAIAAEWLLKTESLSLVLIAGLLGFGLLGAACSTFIRNVGKRSPGDPLVENLTGVILRGASAAIMIFLGVYGGLAVFAGPSVSPNPYVVLFTCFVAAVYSEDAWSWGSREFNSRLSGGGRQTKGGDASTEACATPATREEKSERPETKEPLAGQAAIAKR